jgi:hypothetical protein
MPVVLVDENAAVSSQKENLQVIAAFFDLKKSIQPCLTWERIGIFVVSVMLKQITRTEGRNSTTVQTFLQL